MYESHAVLFKVFLCYTICLLNARLHLWGPEIFMLLLDVLFWRCDKINSYRFSSCPCCDGHWQSGTDPTGVGGSTAYLLLDTCRCPQCFSVCLCFAPRVVISCRRWEEHPDWPSADTPLNSRRTNKDFVFNVYFSARVACHKHVWVCVFPFRRYWC